MGEFASGDHPGNTALVASKPISGSGRSPSLRPKGSEELQLVSATGINYPDSANLKSDLTHQALAAQLSKISLTEAIGLSLAENPDLITQRQADPVSTAALGVANTYPFNPYVQVQATPLEFAPRGGPGTVYHYVLLMQTIQLAHQQQFREDAGAATLNSVRWNIHQAELLNVAQTQRLYFTALYQRGLRNLAAASDANNQTLLRTLEKQLDAGQATAADVAIVRVDARSTHQQAQLAEANYETALRELRRQLNLSPTADVEPSGDLWSFEWRLASSESLGIAREGLEIRTAALDTDALVNGLAGSRPDVLAGRSDVDVARANLRLATASRTTDLQIGPYYQRTEGGTTYFGFRGQIDLMVINNGVPLERQRWAEYHQRLTAWRQLGIRAELEASAAWERYELAYRLVQGETNFARNDLPSELLKLEEQFRANEVDVVRVVQGRTSLILNERAQLDLLNELAQAAANLTSAAGIPPDSLVNMKAEPIPNEVEKVPPSDSELPDRSIDE